MPYYVKTFEWHALLLNLKPVVFLEYGPGEEKSVKALAPVYAAHGLKYAYWNMRAEPLARYKDTRNRRSFCGLFLSRKTELIDRLIAAYQNDDTLRIGRLLGYPACCTEYMAGKLARDPEVGLCVSNNAMAAGLPVSPGAIKLYSPEMNFLSHYDGRISGRELLKLPAFARIFSKLFPFTLTDHLPCSLSCRKSAARGRLVSAVIKKADPGWHSEALDLNGSPVLYLDNFRFYILKGTGTFGEIKFSGIRFATETSSRLHLALKRAGKIRRLGRRIALFSGNTEIFSFNHEEKRPALLPFSRESAGAL